MHIHSQECNNFNPPFLTYVPTGVLSKNIKIENDLKGMIKKLSKCTENKYQQSRYDFGKPLNIYPHNKKEC